MLPREILSLVRASENLQSCPRLGWQLSCGCAQGGLCELLRSFQGASCPTSQERVSIYTLLPFAVC